MKTPKSILHDETETMLHTVQDAVNQGHRDHWGVSVKENPRVLHDAAAMEHGASMEAGSGHESVKKHPLLQHQGLDGIDITVIQQPTDPELREEFEKERQKQQLELQHRLGLANKLSATNVPIFNPRPSR